MFFEVLFFVRTGEPTEHAELNARYACNFSFTIFLVQLTSTPRQFSSALNTNKKKTVNFSHPHKHKKNNGQMKTCHGKRTRGVFLFPRPWSLFSTWTSERAWTQCMCLSRTGPGSRCFHYVFFFSASLFGEVEIWLILGINNVVNPC